MTVAIRQEINLINREEVGSAGYFIGLAKVPLGNYNDSTAYFEIIAKNTSSDVAAKLFHGTDSGPTTLAVSSPDITSSSYALYRSTSFSLSATNIYYRAAVSSGFVTIKSAKVIILQDATDITATQTQIEVGAYEEFDYTDTANYALVEPKYWRYEASKWDPTPTFHFACTTMEGEMSACNYYLQEASDAGFTSNLSVVATISAVENSTPTYHESTSFTPTDGYFYRVQFSQSSARKGGIIYNAKVIATQTSIESHPTSYYSNNYAFNGNWTGFGQSFESKDTQYINSVKFYLKIGAGSPTGTLVAKLYAHTGTFGTSSLPTGAALATSETIDASTITGSYVLYEFTFLTPYQLSASTYYVVTVEYTGGSPINYLHVGYDESATEHPGNLCRDDSGWGAQADDIIFYVYFSPISKLQPEYLLINAAQTDTGLQEFQTYWDPDEWDGVDNTYYHEHSASAASSNTKLQTDLDTTPVDIPNSEITGDDLTRGGSALTMPTTAKEIDSYIVTA